MLGISVGDVEDEGQVHDVIGEVCNIVGGNLKSRLCDSGFPCELSIPTITAGSDFQIKSRGWELNARFGFQNHEHAALVEIFMKCVPK
jgi:chemotaxis protein CheX